MIDNIFTNNICKQHTSGIITSPVSDHLINFCILEGDHNTNSIQSKLVEIENMNTNSINNFKIAVQTADIYSELNLEPYANPNINYNIVSTILSDLKNVHIPRKVTKFNKRKHKKQKWMTNELLSLVNKKNDMYREWRSTEDNIEFNRKKTTSKPLKKLWIRIL